MKYGTKINTLPPMFFSWRKERDEVAKSYDVEKFKTFYLKWQKKGIYDKRVPLPSDKVIEISMRKMVYNMNSSTAEEKAEAKRWLEEHGCTTEMR